MSVSVSFSASLRWANITDGERLSFQDGPQRRNCMRRRFTVIPSGFVATSFSKSPHSTLAVVRLASRQI